MTSINTWPRAGSGVVRIDPLRFLAGCRTRQLNQV